MGNDGGKTTKTDKQKRRPKTDRQWSKMETAVENGKQK